VEPRCIHSNDLSGQPGRVETIRLASGSRASPVLARRICFPQLYTGPRSRPGVGISRSLRRAFVSGSYRPPCERRSFGQRGFYFGQTQVSLPSVAGGSASWSLWLEPIRDHVSGSATLATRGNMSNQLFPRGNPGRYENSGVLTRQQAPPLKIERDSINSESDDENQAGQPFVALACP
jgi:hypothetical protein